MAGECRCRLPEALRRLRARPPERLRLVPGAVSGLRLRRLIDGRGNECFVATAGEPDADVVLLDLDLAQIGLADEFGQTANEFEVDGHFLGTHAANSGN